jgi:hypothetical protein
MRYLGARALESTENPGIPQEACVFPFALNEVVEGKLDAGNEFASLIQAAAVWNEQGRKIKGTPSRADAPIDLLTFDYCPSQLTLLFQSTKAPFGFSRQAQTCSSKNAGIP